MTRQIDDKRLEKLAGGVDGMDFLIWQKRPAQPGLDGAAGVTVGNNLED